MAQNEINNYRFYIHDYDIVNRILDGVEYVSLNYYIDQDGSYLIIVKKHNNEMLSKSWIRLHYGYVGWYIRTPVILKQFVGKKVEYYIETSSPLENEIFRIKPIDFKFMENKKVKKRNVVPYILDSGIFVLPMEYVKKHVGSHILSCKLSFNNNTALTISCGTIYCHITRERGGFSSKLRIYKDKICTGRMNKIVNLIDVHAKKLSDFIYEETIARDYTDYGIIVFKEKDKNAISDDGE